MFILINQNYNLLNTQHPKNKTFIHVVMAGNEGMSKGMTMSSAATDEACRLGVKKAGQLEYDAEPIRDMVNMSDYSLSEQLDLEMSKIEEMIRCLEQMERQFEQQKNSKQTVVKSVRDIDIIQYQVGYNENILINNRYLQAKLCARSSF